MKNFKLENDTSAQIQRKADYAAPSIKTFGAVGSLTQAGTGEMAEGVNMMNVNRQMN